MYVTMYNIYILTLLAGKWVLKVQGRMLLYVIGLLGVESCRFEAGLLFPVMSRHTHKCSIIIGNSLCHQFSRGKMYFMVMVKT